MNNYSCPPTGNITYRELLEHLLMFNDEQLDMDVTIEDLDMEECYEAQLIFAGHNHDVLDEWHPIISTISMED